jgi:hypothetical protein
MKIGIIGAGNIGGTLTRRFRQLWHEASLVKVGGAIRSRVHSPLFRRGHLELESVAIGRQHCSLDTNCDRVDIHTRTLGSPVYEVCWQELKAFADYCR